MDKEVIVVDDSISRYGMRFIHAIRAGDRVNWEWWQGEIPDEYWETCEKYERYDEGVDVWHLFMWWRVHERG